MKRVKVNPKKCPNPLFASWLENWKEDAKLRGSEMEFCFGRALNTLKKFPLPLNSGRECLILENFGPKLCAMLDKKLADYNAGKCNNTKPMNSLKNKNDEDLSTEIVLPIKKSKKIEGEKQTAKKNKNSVPKHDGRLQNPNNLGAYIPAWRSGGYAIILTLYEKSQEPGFIGHMNKADLQADAQKYCDNALKKPEPGSRYSAWASMSTLIARGLVIRKSNPAKYSLTDAGLAVALQLSEVDENDSATQLSSECIGVANSATKSFRTSPTLTATESSPWEIKDDDPVPPLKINQPFKSDYVVKEIWEDDFNTEVTSPYDNCRGRNVLRKEKTENSHSGTKQIDDRPEILNIDEDIQMSCSSSSDNSQTIILRPQNFDVILLVDDRETAGGKTRPKDDPTLAELTQSKVKFEVRNLKIGDFAWIAKAKDSGEELILPYIVERKRMDDLGGSIKDGRYSEQKFRLKKSGIENIIYLIEDHGKNQFTGLPVTTLYQAATNTLIQDGFTIKYTKSHRDSMFYLASMTVLLSHIFQEKTLLGCKKDNLVPANMASDLVQLMVFKDFNKAAAKVKVFKAKEMFIRQLIQLNGMSVPKAVTIIDYYPTPKVLKNAYAKSGAGGVNLLADIRCGITKRQIGPALSKTLHQFYTRKDF